MNTFYKITPFGFLLIISLFILACEAKQKAIPKPPTYLRVELPERSYSNFEDETCSLFFTKPSYFSVKKAQGNTCNKDIEFSSLNGTLHLSYIKMDTTLAAYVNYANDKVDEHKIKATSIRDTHFISKENNAYGTFFELQGNVATPFQFYLTDSITTFVSGVVYFNARPNYDSIRPVLDFVKKDLYKMMETLHWNKANTNS